MSASNKRSILCRHGNAKLAAGLPAEHTTVNVSAREAGALAAMGVAEGD